MSFLACESVSKQARTQVTVGKIIGIVVSDAHGVPNLHQQKGRTIKCIYRSALFDNKMNKRSFVFEKERQASSSFMPIKNEEAPFAARVLLTDIVLPRHYLLGNGKEYRFRFYLIYTH